MLTTQTIEAWKVEIDLHGHSKDVHYFANEGLARLAVAWAYAVHKAQVESRPDFTPGSLEEHPNFDDGSWKVQDLIGMKLVWAQNVGLGRVIWRKNYFTAEHEVIKRTIVG